LTIPTRDSEVIFKYNFTGTLTARGSWTSSSQNDCVTAADDSLGFIVPPAETGSMSNLTSSRNYLRFHPYQDLSSTAAIIRFCLRVDYNYVDGDGVADPSTYETNVTICRRPYGQLHSTKLP
jgi:hypothetical protein